MILITLNALNDKGEHIKYWPDGFTQDEGLLNFLTITKKGKKVAHTIPYDSIMEIQTFEDSKENPEENDNE